MIKTLDFEKPIYVLGYHPWEEAFRDFFVAHLSWLKENGFETLSLETLVHFLRG